MQCMFSNNKKKYVTVIQNLVIVGVSNNNHYNVANWKLQLHAQSQWRYGNIKNHKWTNNPTFTKCNWDFLRNPRIFQR